MKRVTLLADGVESGGFAKCWLTMPGDAKDLHVHMRHILHIEDADARDFAPPVPATARDVLTVAELDALPTGAVVEATVVGERVRAIRRASSRTWALNAQSSVSGWSALSRELEDVVLVTDAPVPPAPVKLLPLPTDRRERFWGRTRDSEPQYWFVRFGGDEYWYLPAMGAAIWPHEVAECGLVRLPGPDASSASDVTS